MNLITEIINLSSKLPTGLKDDKCLVKLGREKKELEEMLSSGDKIGAILEASDCAYYLVKAYVNRAITWYDAEGELGLVAREVDLSVVNLLRVVISKYSLRAAPGNPKNDKEERKAVSALLGDLQQRDRNLAMDIVDWPIV